MTVALPGLRGGDPLGFVAAMGLLSLSEQGEIPHLRLGWTAGGAPLAIVDGPIASVEDLASSLSAAFDRLRRAGAAIPGVPPDFPLATSGTKDPMRMSRDEMRGYYERFGSRWLDHGDPWPARWLIALAAQAAVKQAERGDVELTPFYAPTGRMTMRSSIFEKTVQATEAVGGPADALVGWRRTSYDGANFDERAKRDAGVTTSGEADNQGAPSPTWLAAMGMRFFPIADMGTACQTVGWQRVRLHPRPYTTRSLIWPVWEPLLDPPGVRALLAHPAMELEAAGEAVAPRRPWELEGLGVAHLFGSSRRTLEQGDGPLGPARLIWSGGGAGR
jgi:hypothetical protein